MFYQVQMYTNIKYTRIYLSTHISARAHTSFPMKESNLIVKALQRAVLPCIESFDDTIIVDPFLNSFL